MELSFSPISPGDLRAYVAHARTFHPSIPVELSSYITTAYAEMRQAETIAGEKALVWLVYFFVGLLMEDIFARRVTRRLEPFYLYSAYQKHMPVWDGIIMYILEHY